MTEALAHQFARDWLEAWNRHDLEGILAHYAEDVEFTSPFVAKLTGEAQGTLRGRTALRQYFAKGLTAFPDLKFELQQVLVGVDSVTLLYRSVNNLLAAETMTLNERNQIVRVQAHYTSTSDPAGASTQEKARPREWRFKDYLLTDDPIRLDVDAVCSLLHATYWANDRPREVIEKGLRHSVCLSLFHQGKQVGLSRAVTDHATFTWVCDVIVHADHRGHGLGKWMVERLLEHPDLQTISHHLCTQDAHQLYERFGFKRIEAMRRSDRPMPFLEL